MPWPCSQILTTPAFSRARQQPSLQEHLAAAGKDTSFNMLVSRVGIKLDEGHLLLKLAVFTVGTKRNTVSRVTLQPNIPPPLATGIVNLTANSNDSRVQLQLSEHSNTDIRMCLPALRSSDYHGWTVLVKVSPYL